MASVELPFGRTKIRVEVPAGVPAEDVAEHTRKAIQLAADKARSENRTLRPLEVLQALRKAVQARWSGARVELHNA